MWMCVCACIREARGAVAAVPKLRIGLKKRRTIHTTISVSSYYYICVLILLYTCIREARGAVAKLRVGVKKRRARA